MYPCGHPRTAENTNRSNSCRVCHNARERERRAAKAEGRSMRLRRVIDVEAFPCGHPRTADNQRTANGSCATCHRQRAREARRLHPERSRAYAKANRAVLREYHRAWRQANPDRIRQYNRRARNIRRLARRDPDTLYWIDLIAGDPCGFCGEPTETVEHIVPRDDGGADHWTNYAGACRSCNSSKHVTSLLRFMLRIPTNR